MRLRLPAHGWLPRKDQEPLWLALEGGAKRIAIAAHRRWGKDEIALHHAACSAMQRVGPYWHMLPLATQARKAIWDAVNPRTGRRRIDDAFPNEIRSQTREQDMFIRFANGSTWQVIGSDNYNSLVGSPPVGVVFSEYALSDPSSWAYIRPILAENNGWALFISTPRGRNHFARLVDFARTDPEWYAAVITVEDSGAIPMEVINRERRELKAERGPEEAEAIIGQEYYCDFNAAIPGAYYGALITRAEREGRIGSFPAMPGFPVGTAWDIGIGDQTVIWFYQQLPSGRVRLVDVLKGSGVGLEWYVQRLLTRPWVMPDHIWPPDGGNAEWGSGKSRPELATQYGIKPRVLSEQERGSRESGIQQVRLLLQDCEINLHPEPWPGETVDEAHERMMRAVDAVRGYHRAWDEKRQTFKDAPEHDWTSDYADSLRYLAVGRRPFRGALAGAQAAVRRQNGQALSDYRVLG